jgi:hypothetical protein
MNERIFELEKQAWEFVDKTWNWANANNPSQATLFKAKFAELIVRESIQAVSDDDGIKSDWYQHVIKEHFGVE